MAFSMDCFLLGISEINVIYFRLIWNMLYPLSYLITFLGGYLILLIFKIVPWKITVLTTTLMYLFIYLQPNLVGGFMKVVSPVDAGGYRWILSDLGSLYDTTTHLKWMVFFGLPFLLLWLLILPSLFFIGLRSNSNKLGNIFV